MLAKLCNRQGKFGRVYDEMSASTQKRVKELHTVLCDASASLIEVASSIDEAERLVATQPRRERKIKGSQTVEGAASIASFYNMRR